MAQAMDRRAFLGVAGASLAVAGCNSLGSDGDDGDGTSSGVASASEEYGDPHADHEWPVEPDPETAPEFDGEWPPGVDATGMADPKAFLRFHDVAVSQSPYVTATMEDTRVEHRPDGSTDTSTVTERIAADVEAERYYIESSRGVERYGADGIHHFRDVDDVVHRSADRAHVTRRAVGGSIPYFHFTFRWTDATRHADRSFALSSGRPAGDGLPQIFREAWRGVPQDGDLSLDSEGRISGWTLTSEQRFHRGGDQYVVEWTSENAVTYTDAVPEVLPTAKPDWVTDD